MRMSRGSTSRRLFAAVGLALLAGACASGPSYPLYSSQAVTGSFGFSEQRLSPGSFQVAYVTPQRRTGDSSRAVEEQRQRLLTLSNDMALWRAADVALANGQKEFRVTRRDNDVTINRRVTDRFAPSPLGYRRWGAPYPYYYRHSPWDYDVDVYVRAQTNLIVEFGRRPGEEFFVAPDVIARLRQTYPGADAPVLTQ